MLGGMGPANFFAQFLPYGIFVLGAAYSVGEFSHDRLLHPRHGPGGDVYDIMFFLRACFVLIIFFCGPTAEHWVGEGLLGVVVLENVLYLGIIVMVEYVAEALVGLPVETAAGKAELADFERSILVGDV